MNSRSKKTPNAVVLEQVGRKGGKWFFREERGLGKINLISHNPQPAVCDFDGDRVPDLLLGAMDGYIYPNRRS
jgi:hypothetical protein